MEAATTQLLIKALTIVTPLAAIILMLYFWLRQEIRRYGQRIDMRGKALNGPIKTQGDELRLEIKVQGERLNKRINEQGKDIRTLIAEVSALRATVETFFRVRIDPPQPPDNPGSAQAGKAT